MTRAVLYARVSSEEQAGEGKSSIATQLADCRALAAKLGWPVVGEFIDDRKYRVGKKMTEPSGTRADRPQWRKMLTELEQGRADAVVAWHSSRLYRGYRPMVDFLEIVDARHIQVQLAKDSFDPRFAVLQAWLGREENSARVERTRFGHMGRARKGFTATRTTVYYTPIREPATGEILGYEFDETYRPHFERMAELFLQRYSYREIGKLMGTNPRTGKIWSYESIRDMLANPFYRGQVAYGRRGGTQESFIAPGRHKAVWDPATCQAIEAEVARRGAIANHAPRSRTSPLAGALFCGWCGKLMGPSVKPHNTRPDGRPYRVYKCFHNPLVRRGYEAGTPHPPNGIAEVTVLRRLSALLAGAGDDVIDLLIGVLAAQTPTTHAGTSDARAALAAVSAQMADLEADIARVRSAGARAALMADLDALKAQADVQQARLVATARPTFNIDTARHSLVELASYNDLLTVSDVELKRIFSGLPPLFVAGGEFVGAPGERVE